MSTRERSTSSRRRAVLLGATSLDGLAETAQPFLLTFLVCGAALALAGANPVVVLVLGSLALLAAASLVFGQRHQRRPSIGPLCVLTALSVLTLLQTIPLPLRLLEQISPSAADVWARSLRPLRETVERAPISIAPPATTLEALKWAIYAVVFALAVSVARKRGAELVHLIVLASASLVAFATIGHEIVGASRVWGLYEPKSAFGFHKIGPFLNPNNLASYMNLGAFAGFGLLQSRRAHISPWITGVLLAVIVAVVFRTGSRGGVGALAFGVLLVVGFTVWSWRKASEQTRSKLLPVYLRVGAVLLVGLLLTAISSGTSIWNEVLTGNEQKFRMLTWVKPMVLDYWLFGIGRGSFETAFFAYRPEMGTHVAFTHPENFVVQWASEWGLFGAAALLALAWWFRPWNVGAGRSALNGTGLAAVAAVMLQNMVDLGLELPGLAVGVAAALGGLWGDLRVRRPVRAPSERRERVLQIILASTVLVSLALAGIRSRSSLDDEREIARRSVEQARTVKDAYPAALEAVRRGLHHYPADYYFPLLGATLTMDREGENPLPWLQRALERGPNVGRTHLALAEALARMGARKQALLELRLAVTYEPPLASSAGRSAVRYSRRYQDLLSAVAEGDAGGATLDAMAESLGPDDRTLRDELDHEAVARNPSLVNPRERIARTRLAALETGDALCADRDECAAAISEQADELTRWQPRSSRGAQIEALLLLLEGRTDEADLSLRSACQLPLDTEPCLQVHVRAAPSEELGALFDRYASIACRSRSKCASAWDWAGQVFAERRLFAQACAAARRAAEQEPTPERWVRAAELARVSNDRRGAQQSLQQALRLDPGNVSALRLRAQLEGQTE